MIADILLLSRDDSPPRLDVWGGIQSQVGVELRVHRIVGPPRPGDRNRLDTIVRARNGGRRLGSAPWVMMLDDDVVLAPDCVARLVEALRGRPGFAAMGADYDGEMTRWPGSWDHPPHVGMGATLFRRERLAGVTFRWEPGKCECRCCCDDLRRGGWGIGLVPGARARHRPERSRRPDPPANSDETPHPPDRSRGLPAGTGRVLAAFDRHHLRKFRGRFLGSLRASGNREPVTALAYGLHPSEVRRLAADGVEVVAFPNNGTSPAIRRLRDFQGVIARWPDETPVAYWDAGDILFQGRLGPLWNLVRAHPDVLLAVREPAGYPESPAIVDWTGQIIDPEARRRTFEILSTHPFLNSGFVAGSARALMRYLREGDRLIHSSELRGLGHWGDQVALNLFCHAQPQVWREIPEAWNYCLVFRDARQFRVGPDGRTDRSDGQPVHVVHGNGGSLRWKELPVRI